MKGKCASISSAIYFALTCAARLDVEDALMMTRGDACGVVASGTADARMTTLVDRPAALLLTIRRKIEEN